ncbi:MAG: crossover junction endodeoxyribonuclease RuvC [Proteobacteria bacterium]|nr:crossover junction endodeoxyribonuclease RuvC [Pseudomonadota bacterium]
MPKIPLVPKVASQVILGIDPGLGVTGFGCIRTDGDKFELIEFGTIRPSSKLSLAERLGLIGDGLNDVFERLAPELCSIEDVFVMKFARPALTLAHARGVAMYVANQRKCPVHEYTTRYVKQSVCGYGNATKDQVIYMVRHLLSYNQPIPSDAADALAIAICHSNSARQARRLGT